MAVLRYDFGALQADGGPEIQALNRTWPLTTVRYSALVQALLDAAEASNDAFRMHRYNIYV